MKTLLALALAAGLTLCLGCGGGAGDDGQSGVILLRYKTGRESTEQRERGFLETLRSEYPDIHILADHHYAGTSRDESLTNAQNVLTKYSGRTTGVFAVCEPNAVGVLRALEDFGLAGKVKFIAFDPSPELIDGLRSGAIQGIVLQDPVKMGYLGVKTMVDHLEGKPVEKRISTGEYVATPENMDGKDAEGNDIKKLLNPVQFTDDLKAKPKTAKYYTLAVIPKGTTHVFWKSVHAGAEQAARELGNVEILWKGSQNENDTAGQIEVVESFIAQRVAGIVLAPNDSSALVDSVRTAKKQGVPVVIFDSGLEDPDAYVSYVATKNERGGELAARRLAEVLGVKPKAKDAGEKTKTP
jgi:ABC-type sugar transport system substrate-binding protein